MANQPTVQLYQGDCLEFMKTLAPGVVDAVVTDPPYSEKTHLGVRSMGVVDDRSGHNPIDFGSVDVDYIRKVFSFSRPKRWLISFMDWRHILDLENNPPDYLEFIRFGVWVKSNPMSQLTGDRPATGWEAVAIFHAPGEKVWNGGGKPATWIHGTTRYGYFGPSNHPTEKPLGLVKTLLEQFTNKLDTVFDPFMGSGTTGVACMQLGRNFIGCEIDPGYFEIAKRRIETARMQLRLEI